MCLRVSRCSFEYLPYGETWIKEGSATINAKYNSQELDTETGFYFYNARHYDPVICRFVTADSVVDGELTPIGWNGYTYVQGNPVVYLDSSGNDSAFYQKIQDEAIQSNVLGNMTAEEALDLYVQDVTRQENEAFAMKAIPPKGATKSLVNRRIIALERGCGATLGSEEVFGDVTKWKEFDEAYMFKMAVIQQVQTKQGLRLRMSNYLEASKLAGRPMPTVREMNDKALEMDQGLFIFQVMAGAAIGVGQIKLGQIKARRVRSSNTYRYMSSGKSGQTPKAAGDFAKQSGLYRDIVKTKGNFGIGSATNSEALQLGKGWVGSGYKVTQQGGKTIWQSADGLRQFRLPSYKPFLKKIQANFEWRTPNVKQWIGNGHLDIKP